MLPIAPIHPDSFLAHFLAERPPLITAGKEHPSHIPWLQWDALKEKCDPLLSLTLSVDKGTNTSKEVMVLATQPFLQTKLFLTVYAYPTTLRSVEGMINRPVYDPPSSRIGEDALQIAQVKNIPKGTS